MLRFSSAAVSVVAVGAVVGGLVAGIGGESVAVECPPGMIRVADAEQRLDPDWLAQRAPQYQGGNEFEFGRERQNGCMPINGPESFMDLALRDAQMSSIRSAPYDEIPEGAAVAAARERDAIVAANPDVPGTGGNAYKYGVGPINSNDERFGSVNNQGFIDNTGRIDDFEFDAETNRLFAAIGTGGVWLSEDRGATWHPLTDNLPSTVISSVAYTPAGGPDGTVVVVTGEHTFGGFAFTGIGTWYSRDLGETWHRSAGPPSDTLGFAAEVDPTNPKIVYAATGKGLWRSTDAGKTFTDVVLPTGRCAGDYNIETCNFANFVTDVVVKHPGGVGADTEGGDVVATVGWRAGQFEGPDGQPQSPANGIYRSATGEPGTFERLDGLEAAIDDGGAERIGRIELGETVGAEQDHDVLYALVEDAVLFQGGPRSGPDGIVLGQNATVFSGVYVSTDFGATWTQLANDQELSDSCLVNLSVYCLPGLIIPGAQSWYNMWIHPDPTQQDPRGIPTRLLFGLEEIWQNRAPGTPTDVGETTTFEVIGRYYADGACLVGNCALNQAPGDNFTTVHPDQHAAIFLPIGDTGQVELFVGHDGGLSRQVAGGVEDSFDQLSWDLDQFNGLQTLLPYQAAIANDGVAYMGLQDNGHVKVIPGEGFAQYGTFGADGTFAAVDPDNSDYAWESTQNAGMNVTTDGGQTWSAAAPPADNVMFVNPAAMDPLDANHLVTGGTQVNETLVGPATADEGWLTVFDLGNSTAPQPDGVDAPPNQMSAVDVRGDGIYVGFCGVCDVINSDSPFQNGIATNVGHSDELPEAGTGQGWHFAAAEGLPNRYITSIAIDPQDPTLQTVYVTLGGYSRSWVPPGTEDDTPRNLGSGHVYKSTDAGETFTDISGNLPDITATWVEPRGDQLLVGTDHGVYLSSDTRGGDYAVLAPDVLPNTPVLDIDLKPDDPNFALIAFYGRGLFAYEFPTGDATSRRLQGSSRIQTAVEVSKAVGDSADTVVLARGDVYADALAGAPLAAGLDAPILLTGGDELAAPVAEEIERLGASRVILLGGEAALSQTVADDVSALGIETVDRIGGQTRFDTARLIAAEVGGREVYVVEGIDADRGRGWPDAMSIAPLAAASGRPILLVDTDVVPQATKDALADLDANAATIVGGASAVSEDVEQELARLVHVRDRIAGANRFETSVAAAEAGITFGLGIDKGLGTRELVLARSGDFPDALAAGPTVASLGGSLVLVPEQDLDNAPASRDFLDAWICGTNRLSLLGGTGAISDRVERQAKALANDCEDSTPATPPDPSPVLGTGGGGTELELTAVEGPFGFEPDNEGWTVQVNGSPDTSWTRDEGNGHDGSSFSFNVIPYGELADTTLTSPSFDTPTGRVFVTWWNTYDVEGGDYDEMHLEVSTDGGDTWETAAEFGGQNVGYPDYAQERVEITPDGDTFQIRFRFFSDEICSSQGFGVDGVCARPDGYEGIRLDDVAIATTS